MSQVQLKALLPFQQLPSPQGPQVVIRLLRATPGDILPS